MHIYGKTCYILRTAHWGRRKAKGKTKLQLASQIFKWAAPQVVLLSIVFQCPYDFPLYIRIYILCYKIIYVFYRIERGGRGCSHCQSSAAAVKCILRKKENWLFYSFWHCLSLSLSSSLPTSSLSLSASHVHII